MAGWVTPTATGVTVSIRVIPGAKINAVEGLRETADGGEALLVRLNAIPEKGRANAALITFLAKTLGLPKSSITVTSGHTSRAKTLAISGDPQALSDTLATLAKIAP